MTAILVAGMSGVGKASVAVELRHRGFLAIDTDADASRVGPDGEWLWDEPRIEQALDAAGCDLNRLCHGFGSKPGAVLSPLRRHQFC